MNAPEQSLSASLREYQIRGVDLEESFTLGNRRFKGLEILAPVAKKKVVLGCIDERKVKELLDPQRGQMLELSPFVVARAVGAVSGLVDAIRNVRVMVERQQILQVLKSEGVVVANHVDTHATSGALTGCGYLVLRSLPESGRVFDRPAVPVTERLASYEQMGALRLVLDGDHAAQGFVVNPFADQVLDPSSAIGALAFFSLDLGVYRTILAKIVPRLGLDTSLVRTILVKLVRNSAIAVFILSKGAIHAVTYLELGNDQEDAFFLGVLHEGVQELKAREGAILRMMGETQAA